MTQDYEKLEFVCKIKDLEIEQEKMNVEKFKTENEEIKKNQNEKTKQIKELKNEVGELKAENEKLKAECVEKDLQMKKLKHWRENLSNENEVMKKEQNEENELVKELKSEVNQLKEESEKLKADVTQDYEKLEFACKIKDLEIMERNMIAERFETENREMNKAQIKNMEQLNKLKSVVLN
ncbi:uncharacterized protein PF3D7_1120000-like [Palaemon carinicauda]|uniref:uncharacterized protein PF3D7_1120000-like n=1 Tax=Palaemon carinicauda TaxID=392227 RepID=UPI0035B5D430